MTPNKRVGATDKVTMMVGTQKQLTETKTLFTISEASLVYHCIPSPRQRIIPAHCRIVLRGMQVMARKMQLLCARCRMGLMRFGRVLARYGKVSACCNTVTGNLRIPMVRQ